MTVVDFFKSSKKGWLCAAGAAAVGPALCWAPGLNPPWPNGVSLIGTLFGIIALFVAFVISAYSKVRLHRLAIIFLVLGGVFALFYLVIYASVVVTPAIPMTDDSADVRIVIGFEKIHGIPEGLTDEQLLEEALFVPERVWTKRSLIAAKILLVFFFVSLFFKITCGVAILSNRLR